MAANRPGTGARPVVPTADAWGRVAEVVKHVEGQRRSTTPRAGRGMGAWSVPACLAKSTTIIGPRSGGTYGTGSIRFQQDTGTALADDTSQPITTVKNMVDKTIASGAYVLVVWALGSWWVAIPGSCTDLS